MIAFRNKYIILNAAVFSVLLFFMLTGTALAEAEKSTGGLVSFTAQVGIEAILIPALYIIQAVLAWMVGFTANLLNNIFWTTIAQIPSSIPVVVAGWGVMRDVANSLFILILLWIALTLIFNLEGLGGKRLFIRTIVIALLLNFSLAMVTALFAISNTAAATFASKMPANPGDFIVNAAKLHTVFKQLSEGEAAANVQAYQKLTEFEKTAASGVEGTASISIKDAALASLGVPTAQAALPWGFIIPCGLGVVGAVVTLGWGLPGAALACGSVAALATAGPALLGLVFGSIEVTIQKAMRIGISIIFMSMAVATFIVAIIAILQRYIMMALLTAIAPLAFLCHIIPGEFAEEHWKKWVSNVFKWAVFAPLFYFFVYMAFFMLEQIRRHSLENPDAITDLNRLVAIIIPFGFLFAGLKIAKQTSGAVGDIVLGLGKTAATLTLGGAAGGLAMGAGAIMRRPAVQEAVDKGTKALSQVPYVGAAMRPVMRKTAKMYAEDREDVQKRAKESEHLGNARLDILRTYKSERLTPNQEKEAAGLSISVLQDKNLSKSLTDAEKERYLHWTAKFKLQDEVLTKNPHLIKDDDMAKRYVPDATDRASALNEIMRRAPDKSEISKDAFKDDGTAASKESVKLITTAVWKNIKSVNEMQKISREAPELADAMLNLLNEATVDEVMTIKKELGQAKAEAIDRYMHGSPMARALWSSQIKSSSGWNSSPLYRT